MRPTDHLPPWRIGGDSGRAAIGPAMSTLKQVIGRLALLVRCAGIVYTAVQVIIWHSFYVGNPWRLVFPGAAIAWAAVMALYLRKRSPGLVFICADSAVYVALALSAQGSVPLGIRGHAFSWLVISVSSQVVVPSWYAPAAWSAPLVFAPSAAYFLGARLIVPADVRLTVVTAVMLFMVAVSHLYARRRLYDRAAAADAALDDADREASEQYVILSRNIEYREHERLLHDTVLNTLTALARADRDDVAAMVNRCRQDVSLIQSRLDPGDPAAGAGSGDLAGSVAGGVRAVAVQMRARGLDVHLKITGEDQPGVPATVATAVGGATREALSNVLAHARTGEAWVELALTDADGGTQVRLTVRDDGTGFDPASIDPARLGLRRSIAERATDCGGQASIWSAPGRGTVVRLSWPAPVPAGQIGRRAAVEESPLW